MPTFKINEKRVKIIDDDGDSLTIDITADNYDKACMCAMTADWNGFRDLFFDTNHINSHPNECTCDGCCCDDDPGTPLQESVDVMIGLLQDELVTPADLGISIPAKEHGHAHDLSNWNGSPIFYPTREMAQGQAAASYGFWLYHDFGIASPAGYRYATVPRGVGPTAPDGYDWVCLPREES